MQPFADAIANKINSMSNGNGHIQIVIHQDIKETADFRKGTKIIDRELSNRGFKLDYAKGGGY